MRPDAESVPGFAYYSNTQSLWYSKYSLFSGNVFRNAISFPHVKGLEDVGEAAGLAVQFGVGQDFLVCGIIALPQDRGPVGALE